MRFLAYRLTLVLVVVALAAAPSAAQDGAPATDTAAADISAYLDSAVAIIRANVLSADTVDWKAFRDSLDAWAAPIDELGDAHWALLVGLRRLNPHSFLQLPPEQMVRIAMQHSPAALATGQQRGPATVLSPFADRDTPAGALIEADGLRIGHVVIPGFAGEHSTAFADSIEAIVRDLDARDACGWIVDLRGNGGGNMWPMLAGIGAVLGEGIVGHFVNASGDTTGDWYYRGGAAGISEGFGESRPIARVSSAPNPYRLEGTPPVAVLYDAGTMSSGEATAIAFIGRPNTRSFGVPSFGFTTGNTRFLLPDSTTMILTTTLEADRNGVVHVGPLQPDEVVAIAPGAVPSEPPAEDPQLAAAREWLALQAGCAAE